MKKDLSEQAICSLLEKSDLSAKEKETIKACLTGACDIKEKLEDLVSKGLFLDEKRNAALDAISSINDAIACMAAFMGRIDITITMSGKTGKYIIYKESTDIRKEIDTLTS